MVAGSSSWSGSDQIAEWPEVNVFLIEPVHHLMKPWPNSSTASRREQKDKPSDCGKELVPVVIAAFSREVAMKARSKM